MLKHAAFTVGLGAVLLAGVAPAGGSCSLMTDLEHACCSKLQPEAPSSSSCCATAAAPVRSQVGALSCDCLHAPATPAAAVESVVRWDGAATQATANAALPARPGAGGDRRPAHRHGRHHPPPPLFLLHSSLLT